MSDKLAILAEILTAYGHNKNKMQMSFSDLVKILKSQNADQFDLTSEKIKGKSVTELNEKMFEYLQPIITDSNLIIIVKVMPSKKKTYSLAFSKSIDEIIFDSIKSNYQIQNTLATNAEKRNALKSILSANAEKNIPYLDIEELVKLLNKSPYVFLLESLIGQKKFSAADVIKIIDPIIANSELITITKKSGRTTKNYLAISRTPEQIFFDAIESKLKIAGRYSTKSEKLQILEKVLNYWHVKRNARLVSLDELINELKIAAEIDLFSDKKLSAENLADEIIDPIIADSELTIFRKKISTSKKPQIYLFRLDSPRELVFDEIKKQSDKFIDKSDKNGIELKSIFNELPLNIIDFANAVNELIRAGRISTLIFIEKNIFVTKILRALTPPPPTYSPPTSIKSPPLSPRQEFISAFDKLDQGRIFVRICNMRRELNWSREKFDSVLKDLRKERIIQLHAGDITSMTTSDVDLSYTDELNIFYVTLTKNKPQYDA